MEGWLGERRCGFEARLHEGCDGCVLSRSAISREGWIRPLSSSKIRRNVIIGEEGRSLFSPEIKTFGNFVVVVERRDVENREAMEDPFEKRKF